MSNKEVLLKRHQLAAEVDEPPAPLDYLQVRNREALQAWRMRLADQNSAVDGGMRHALARTSGAQKRAATTTS